MQEDGVARIGGAGAVVAQIQQIVVYDGIVDQVLVLGVIGVGIVAAVDQRIVLFAVGAGGAPVHIVGDLGIRQQAAGVVVDAVGFADLPGSEGRFRVALGLLAGAVLAHDGGAGKHRLIFSAPGLIDRQLRVEIAVDGGLDADAVFAVALGGDGLGEQGLFDLLLGNDVFIALEVRLVDRHRCNDGQQRQHDDAEHCNDCGCLFLAHSFFSFI